MEYLIYFLLIIGLLVNTKFYYWATISKKGFGTETPLLFLKHANVYAIIDIIIFILVIIFVKIAWYIIVVSYLLSFVAGGIIAENKAKEIIKEVTVDRYKERHEKRD